MDHVLKNTGCIINSTGFGDKKVWDPSFHLSLLIYLEQIAEPPLIFSFHISKMVVIIIIIIIVVVAVIIPTQGLSDD